jgi:hypothetical protein
VNSKTLYLSSVQIEGGVNNNRAFVYIDFNRNNNPDYYVSVSHPTSPIDRKFWPPYYLFNQRVGNEYLRIYQSLIITISEATRFHEIKQYVAGNFSRQE